MCDYRKVSCQIYISICYFELYSDPRDLCVLTHSFPTRPSSGLRGDVLRPVLMGLDREAAPLQRAEIGAGVPHVGRLDPLVDAFAVGGGGAVAHRSEEHTSELQSLMRISYAVFCLKKKKAQYNTDIPHTTLTACTQLNLIY